MKVPALLLVLCALVLSAPTAARAQQNTDHLKDLQISVWPEFDDPRVLVQYDGNLAANDGYPRNVSFYIPATAALNATAYEDDSQKLMNTDPATVGEAKNGFKLVTFKLPKPHFHVEYYDDALQGSPDKTLAFVYRAAQPVDAVNLEIQQPLKAENFKTVPAAALQSPGAHDFKYYIFNYPNVTADQALSVNVSYTKTDPNPSITNVQPPADATQPQAAGATTVNAPTNPQEIYVIAGIGVLFALGLLAVWMWYRRGEPQLAFAAPRAGKAKSKGGHTGGTFCAQCGNELKANDNFCPRCGTKRR